MYVGVVSFAVYNFICIKLIQLYSFTLNRLIDHIIISSVLKCNKYEYGH